jgi:aspartate 4-decarboxylase
VYSFSKYFGVTGWRLGVIMLNQRNVIDDMIENVINLNEKKKAVLDQRYRIDSETPQQIRFIDRLCLDSRDVALGHTAGIACPGQIIMSLFALYNLIHQQTYKPAIKNILDERIKYLYKELKLTYSETPHDTHYYALLDILELAENKYDKKFAMYLLKYYYPVDFVFCLAINTASVCLPGYGFFEPEEITEDEITPQDRNNWSIRVSLANLETDRYLILSKNIMSVLADYHKQYKEDKKKKSR